MEPHSMYLCIHSTYSSSQKTGAGWCACAKPHADNPTISDASSGMRSLIKDELEPHMRDFSPSVVNGLFFERLSFGLVPMSIMGVRIVPPQTYSGSNVAIGEAAAPQNAHGTML